MTRIDRLRRQLVSLASRQRFTSRGASLARVIVATLLALAAVFACDYFFDLPPLQRLVAIGVGLLVLLRAAFRNASAFRSSATSVTQTALEATPEESGDLVAALQFSSSADASLGSLQLKQAVVEQVESSPIDVFAGFRWTELRNALLALTALAAIAWLAIAFFPVHAAVFANRLAMGQRMYPKSTEILAVAVNGQYVLQRQAGDESQPNAAHCGQGKAVLIQVRTDGFWPETGALTLTSRQTGATRSVELTRLTTAKRLAPLRSAQQDIQRALADPQAPAPAVADIENQVAIEIPQLSQGTPEPPPSQKAAVLKELLGQIETRLEQIEKGPADAIWQCELARLIEPANYRLSIGDGRTMDALLDVVEVPVIDLEMQVTPPKYAGVRVASPASLARQFAVLEGSQVDVTLRVLTKAPLRRAWLNVWQGDTQSRIALAPLDDDRKQWRIPEGQAGVFQNIQEETRYEALAEDVAGYAIEKPLGGMIRVKPDRPPTGSAQVVHRVVLPTAAPVINYRVNDDFAVAEARIAAQVERRADSAVTAVEPGVSAETTASDAPQAEKKQFVAFNEIKTKDQLPAKGRYTLNLASLGLNKGDRLKLTIEVRDYRGQAEGKWSSSEAIFLEISDESGVLSAISETDERSEQKLDDLIRRELGIGDEP